MAIATGAASIEARWETLVPLCESKTSRQACRGILTQPEGATPHRETIVLAVGRHKGVRSVGRIEE